jgi:hypothetical protein
MDTSKLSTDEKLDLILKYQKSQRFWAIVKALFSLSMFIIFIVIPIVWAVMFVREHLAGVDLSQINQILENLKSVDMELINQNLSQVGDLLN